ncbi:hypothetical protein HY489_06515 [Candidatus Woesearchaeota archaeon]|nr:hypothetical protein [Candidatus Woesearchaeota archaeon]
MAENQHHDTRKFTFSGQKAFFSAPPRRGDPNDAKRMKTELWGRLGQIIPEGDEGGQVFKPVEHPAFLMAKLNWADGEQTDFEEIEMEGDGWLLQVEEPKEEKPERPTSRIKPKWIFQLQDIVTDPNWQKLDRDGTFFNAPKIPSHKIDSARYLKRLTKEKIQFVSDMANIAPGTHGYEKIDDCYADSLGRLRDKAFNDGKAQYRLSFLKLENDAIPLILALAELHTFGMADDSANLEKKVQQAIRDSNITYLIGEETQRHLQSSNAQYLRLRSTDYDVPDLLTSIGIDERESLRLTLENICKQTMAFRAAPGSAEYPEELGKLLPRILELYGLTHPAREGMNWLIPERETTKNVSTLNKIARVFIGYFGHERMPDGRKLIDAYAERWGQIDGALAHVDRTIFHSAPWQNIYNAGIKLTIPVADIDQIVKSIEEVGYKPTLKPLTTKHGIYARVQYTKGQEIGLWQPT